jgi:hypothetical protein
MALGFTQPLTEMSTRRSSWGKARPTRKTDVTAIYEPPVYTSRVKHAAFRALELIDIKIDIKILVEIFFVKTIFQQPRRQEV